VVRLAEEPGPLRAGRGDLGDQGSRVVLTTAHAPACGRLVEATAYAAVDQRGERGLDGRRRQREDVAIQAAGLGRRRGGLDRIPRESVQLGSVADVEGHRVGLGEQLLPELGGEPADLVVEHLQPLTVGFGQSRSGPDEVEVVTVEHARLLLG